MAYAAWSVTYGEQPSAAKWNQLGTNDALFYTYTGDGTNAIQQVQYQQIGTTASGTTTMPYDDTIPQNTEGTQFLTKAITPKATTNLLIIDAFAPMNFNGTPATMTMALFQDSTVNALAGDSQYAGTSGGTYNMRLRHIMTAGTTSSTTFNIRVGADGAGTYTINGVATASRRLGGVSAGTLTITEYKV